MTLLLAPSAMQAAVVELVADRDNTLVESASGTLSNGSGSYMFSGRTGQPSNYRRRALVHFDVAAAIPAGSTVTAVELQLTVSRVKTATARTHTLHRVLQAWGEGASDAGANEGGGAAAQAGDATWVHRFYDTQDWSTIGGTFSINASAQTNLGGLGTYSWSGAGMVDDVQSWIDGAENHGWVLVGNEDVPSSSKRLDSRENGSAATRPRLIVTYEEVADTDGDGVPDADDNCPAVANPDQLDSDDDMLGDACDDDDDNDGVPDVDDPFPLDPTEWADNDGDGIGDNADPDDDNDGLDDDLEASVGADPNSADSDGDGVPDAVEAAGGIGTDSDDDTLPDIVDDDDDGDGYLTLHETAVDTDGDGIPNYLDTDSDDDGVPDETDNCPYVANPGQEDSVPGDGVGDACIFNLDVDGNGAVEPLSDGLLVLRYLFGFRGAALADGLLGDDPVPLRDNAAALEAFLAQGLALLDVDGDGTAAPLSDGLLVLRYIYGFRATALSGREIGPGAAAHRDEPGELEGYLFGLQPPLPQQSPE